MLLASCSAQPPRLEGVSVSLVQYRDDYGPRHLQVKVSNGSDKPVTITAVALSAPQFATAATLERRVEVPAGLARDLEVALGAPDCEAAAGTAGADAAVVTLGFELADGRTGEATVTSPDDPQTALPRIRAEDCIAEGAERVATLAMGDELRVKERDGRLVAIVELSATPTGAAGRLRVAAVDRTILVRPASGDASWPLDWDLSAGAAPQRAELALVPNNCNPHVVAEDKRGTFFPLEAELDDGTTGLVPLPVSDEVRGAIYAFIGDACGW